MAFVFFIALLPLGSHASDILAAWTVLDGQNEQVFKVPSWWLQTSKPLPSSNAEPLQSAVAVLPLVSCEDFIFDTDLENTIVVLEPANVKCDIRMRIKKVEAAPAVIVLVREEDSGPTMDPSHRYATPVVLVPYSSVRSFAEVRNFTGMRGFLRMAKQPSFELAAPIALVIMALACVAAGSIWMSSLAPPSIRLIDGLGARESEDSQATVKLDTAFALGMVVFSSVILLLLFFLPGLFIYFFLLFFAVSSFFSLNECLLGLARIRPLKASAFAFLNQKPFSSVFSWLELLVGFLSISTVCIWAVFRNSSFSWVLVDILGMSISINAIRVLRMPNLRVATIFLCLLFFYDIFWVFVSPLFFGKSVMISVTLPINGESLPILLTVPRFGAEFAATAKLGLGDIVLPGLFVAFCRQFDVKKAIRGSPYFLVCYFAYALGLVLAMTAVYYTQSGQPALFYIVPSVLGAVFVVGLLRKEVKEMWNLEQSQHAW